MFFIKTNNLSSSPNIYIIKKKDFSLAVTRNKIKRRMKNVLKELGFNSGLIIICKPGIENIDFGDLKMHAEKELQKIVVFE